MRRAGMDSAGPEGAGTTPSDASDDLRHGGATEHDLVARGVDHDRVADARRVLEACAPKTAEGADHERAGALPE